MMAPDRLPRNVAAFYAARFSAVTTVCRMAASAETLIVAGKSQCTRMNITKIAPWSSLPASGN